MSNRVTASIRFYFKGVSHTPSVSIELNEYLETSISVPDLYPIIAKANNYDLYSYEYEMMQAEDIVFSEARGLVAEFITDGVLDLHAFERAWEEGALLKELVDIARKELSIDDLDKRPDIKQALMDAYRRGVASRKP
ncbi:hypothetical protein MNBD_GAMMA11-734 [hydrothermal vent metagenome]|uniref:Uncharacterized protein n=1 Tax=hydrothermal vent metagenome TaxID=652676 RepID=A0A3B0X1C4_9ZZZZ